MSSYLFASAAEPVDAWQAVRIWTDGPPDLSLISPSSVAEETALFASAGRFVRILDEPLLAGRAIGESTDDFAVRFAQALRTVLAYDGDSVLVVCDELPGDWEAPFVASDRSVEGLADRLERMVPLP